MDVNMLVEILLATAAADVEAIVIDELVATIALVDANDVKLADV